MNWKIIVLVLVLAPAGCGSSSSSPTDYPNTLADFERSMKALVCNDATAMCCSTNGFGFSKPACDDIVSLAVQGKQPLASTLTGAPVTFNKEAAHQCLALLRTEARACEFNTVLDTLHAPCGVVLSADIAVGGSCSVDNDCAQPAGQIVACRVQTGIDTRCQSLALGQAGDACSKNAICSTENDLVCRADTATCGARSEAGAACRYDGDCVRTAPYCRAGHCIGFGASGQSCGTGNNPASCDRGLACQNLVCQPAARSGELCSAGSNPQCEDGSSCTPLSSTEMRCVRSIGAVCVY